MPRTPPTPTTFPPRSATTLDDDNETRRRVATTGASSPPAMAPFPGDVGPVMLPPPPLLPNATSAGIVQSGLFGPSSFMHMSAPPAIRARSRLNSDAPSFSPRAAVVDKVEVRDVWAANLEEEMYNIGALLPIYPVVCMDTEFPGTVHDGDTPRHLRTPRESYAVVKRNVDELQLLQLGISLSDPAGRFPVVWQFNFAGFDARRDPHSRSSIAMLAAHGMEFTLLRRYGIDHDVFARAFYRSVLGCGRLTGLTWAAFSGSYDFAYLAKVLTGGRPLPETLEGFLAQVESIFGPAVLDVKYLARFCGKGGGIRGGLEHVAAALGVQRAAGRAHNAGSDSLLTSVVLHAMVDRFFPNSGVLNHAGAIEGLVQCSNLY